MAATKYLIHPITLWAELNRDIGEKQQGIYKLHCLADDNEKYRPISRLLGEDKEGVLYIGSSQDVFSRVIKLKISLCAAANNYDGYVDINSHQCGKKYSQNIQVKLPFKSLCVTIYPLPQDYKGHVEDEETFQLLKYEENFGELPPMNDVLPQARWRSQ